VAVLSPAPACCLSAGDIIISSRPINPHENIIKRVTALQGQEVKVYRRGEVAPLVVKVSRPEAKCLAAACVPTVVAACVTGVPAAL
jgi:hypothetical protein